jgi:hypothetical protein
MTILESDGSNRDIALMSVHTSESINDTVDNNPLIQKANTIEKKILPEMALGKLKMEMLKNSVLHDDRVTMKYYGIYNNYFVFLCY